VFSFFILQNSIICKKRGLRNTTFYCTAAIGINERKMQINCDLFLQHLPSLSKPGAHRKALEESINCFTAQMYLQRVMGDMGDINGKEKEKKSTRSTVHLLNFPRPRHNTFVAHPVANKRRLDREVVNAAQVELISHFVFIVTSFALLLCVLLIC
jgi:hypothetical protein